MRRSAEVPCFAALYLAGWGGLIPEIPLFSWWLDPGEQTIGYRVVGLTCYRGAVSAAVAPALARAAKARDLIFKGAPSVK